MKTSLPCFAGLILIAFAHSSVAAPSSHGRTVTDLKVISTRALQRSISPKFYKSLLVSPVEGWVVVQGSLAGTRLSDLKVTHSELAGRFDGLALQLAKELQIAGYYSIDRPNSQPPVLLHLLIYQIADGTMALSFPQFSEPGGDQMQYYGCARLAVLKKDGKWTEIKGPVGLEGKGWAVRQGFKNKMEGFLKLNVKRLPWG